MEPSGQSAAFRSRGAPTAPPSRHRLALAAEPAMLVVIDDLAQDLDRVPHVGERRVERNRREANDVRRAKVGDDAVELERFGNTDGVGMLERDVAAPTRRD